MRIDLMKKDVYRIAQEKFLDGHVQAPHVCLLVGME